MRTRNHDWFDTLNERPVYSFQVFAGGKWCHPHNNGLPLVFTDPDKRDAKRAEVRKQKEPKP